MSEPSKLPPIAGSPLSVVLLAFPSAGDRSQVLETWHALLRGLGREFEILVVEAGSNGTSGPAVPMPERWSGVQILSPPDPRGFGAALRTGLTAARYPLVFYTTCDQQFQPAGLKQFLELIDEVHLISGFRVSAPVPFWLRGLGLLYRGLVRVVFGETLEPLPGWLGWRGQARRLLARLFFGVRLQDVDCAYRLCRRSIFARIPIQSNGPFAQVEILAKANFLGCVMTDQPIAHSPSRTAATDPLGAPLGQTMREAYKVLSKPDFGPAILPVELPAPAEDKKVAESPVSENP